MAGLLDDAGSPGRVKLVIGLERREAQDRGARGELTIGRSQNVEALLADWLAGKNVRPTTRRRGFNSDAGTGWAGDMTSLRNCRDGAADASGAL